MNQSYLSNPLPTSPPLSFYLSSESSKTTLWMGDLDSWMDEQYLQQLWSSKGENVVVKLIRDKRSGNSLGYAFIGFDSSISAQRALATVHGTKMPNAQRPFRLNWASGGGILDKKEDRAPEYSLFVGDLSNDVDETYLLAMFRQRYPSCHSAKVMTDPVSGLSRGYGFVRFHDLLEQQQALTEMNGVYCGHRPIRISLATPKGSSTGHPSMATLSPPPGPPPPTSSSSSSSSSKGHHQLYQQPQQQLQQQQQQQHQQRIQQQQQTQARYHQLALQAPALVQQPTDPSNTTVFVGGLSVPLHEDELRQYFAPFGEVTYVKIPPGKGCGFVQYVSRQSAEMAIESMNGFQIGQSRIRLSWGRSQNDKGPVSQQQPITSASPPPPPSSTLLYQQQQLLRSHASSTQQYQHQHLHQSNVLPASRLDQVDNPFHIPPTSSYPQSTLSLPFDTTHQHSFLRKVSQPISNDYDPNPMLSPVSSTSGNKYPTMMMNQHHNNGNNSNYSLHSTTSPVLDAFQSLSSPPNDRFSLLFAQHKDNHVHDPSSIIPLPTSPSSLSSSHQHHHHQQQHVTSTDWPPAFTDQANATIFDDDDIILPTTTSDHASNQAQHWRRLGGIYA